MEKLQQESINILLVSDVHEAWDYIDLLKERTA
jgi:hypothetical protein